MRRIVYWVSKLPGMRRVVIWVSKSAVLLMVSFRGMPETFTCGDVLESNRKLRLVARAVYEELVGLEESQRRIHGDGPAIGSVADRFPRGAREVEPLVRAACEGATPADKALIVVFGPLKRELGLTP
jgi:hypothetical protein